MNSAEIIGNTSKSYPSRLVSITKNAGITATGFLFLNIVSFVSNVMITRYLGADQYGLFVLVTRILEVAVIISSLGFANTIIRYVAFYNAREDHQRIKGTIFYSLRMVLIFSFIFVALLFLVSRSISEGIFESPEIIPFLRVLFLTIPLSAISMVYFSTMNGLKQIKQTVVIKNFINPSLFIFMVGIVLIMDWGLIGIIYVYLVLGIFVSLISFNRIRNSYLLKQANVQPITEKKELWHFSMPMLINQFFNNSIRLVPVFLIGIYLSEADIGVFNVSLKIALVVSFSLEVFIMIFSPVMAELFSKNDREIIEKLYKTITKWIFTLSLLVFCILILFTKPLLSIFGSEFTAGSIILLIIASGELVNSSVGLVGNVILMSGRPITILFNSILSFVLITLLCVFLIPPYGIKGAAISVAITMASINIIRLFELYYLEKMHPYKKSYYKPLLSVIIAFALTYFVILNFNLNQYIELVIGSTLLVFVFLICNWILRFDEEDKIILNTLLVYFRK